MMNMSPFKVKKVCKVSISLLLILCSFTANASINNTNTGSTDSFYSVKRGFHFFEEVRGGAHWHSPGYKEGDTSAVNTEFLSSRFTSYYYSPLARFLTTPRIHFGVTANTGRETSHAYTGLTWSHSFNPRVFLDFSFGFGVHDGTLEPEGEEIRDNDELLLGCRALFREQIGIGYQVNGRMSLQFNAEHLSHAGLCSEYNDGITSAGIRFGLRL